MRAQSENAERALSLLNGIQQKNTKLIQSGLPKLTILKFISQIYTEKLKLIGNKNLNPLYVVVYDYFMNKYGLKKVAESKFIQMLESTKMHLDVLKINRFSRLVGLHNAYDNNVADFYFECIKMLDISGQGFLITSNISEVFYITQVFK